MNKHIFFVLCAVALLIANIAFFKASHKAAQQDNVIDSNGQSQSNQDKIPPPPLPPPSPPREKIILPPPEPVRTLIGVTDEELLRVERLLASGEKIATYPIGKSSLKAALSYTDLNGDGKTEVIFVHTEGEAATTKNIPLLRLNVLTNNGENPTKRFSVRLKGMYIYTNIYDQDAAPFAVRDITGDGRPEIIITSAIGASLGATLQAFSLNGESLSQIARVEGKNIDIIDKGAGKAAVIRSRWNDEETVENFVWNGQEFQETHNTGN